MPTVRRPRRPPRAGWPHRGRGAARRPRPATVWSPPRPRRSIGPGYHGTDTNRIARAAGYAPGTFYKHFPDKRAILLAAYEVVGHDRVAGDRARRRAGGTRGRRAPERIIEAMLGFHRTWRGLRASLRGLVALDRDVRAFYLGAAAPAARFAARAPARHPRPRRPRRRRAPPLHARARLRRDRRGRSARARRRRGGAGRAPGRRWCTPSSSRLVWTRPRVRIERASMSVTWDLTPLYAAPDDPRIDGDVDAAASKRRRISSNAIAGASRRSTSAALARAITAYEDLDEQARRPGFYAHLLLRGRHAGRAARRSSIARARRRSASRTRSRSSRSS